MLRRVLLKLFTYNNSSTNDLVSQVASCAKRGCHVILLVKIELHNWFAAYAAIYLYI